jgi:zinc transporter
MSKEGHILLAYGFGDDGTALPLKGKKISVEIKNEGLAWVHLDADNEKTRSWLKKEVNYLDKIIVEALLADETRPRLVKFDNGSLIILRAVNLNANSAPEDMTSIRIWIDAQRIISLQKRSNSAIAHIDNQIKCGHAPKSSGEFLTMLCTELTDRLAPVLEEINEMTADIEEKVLENHDVNLREDIIGVRKKVTIFRRYLTPQKEVIGALKISNQDWLNDMDRRNLQENYDHMVRYVEDLDEIKERSQIIHDELTNSITEKLNKNMYVMSVIASIFLPLTFLTGMFGMNVGGIPFNTNVDGFYTLTAIACAVGGLQILYFKRKKWF